MSFLTLFLMVAIFIVILIFVLFAIGIINLDADSDRQYPPFARNWVARFPDGKLMNIAYRYVNVNGDECWHFSGTEKDYEIVANESDGDIIIQRGAESGSGGLFIFKKTLSGAEWQVEGEDEIKFSALRVANSEKVAQENTLKVTDMVSKAEEEEWTDSKKTRADMDIEFSKHIQQTEFLKSVLPKKIKNMSESFEEKQPETQEDAEEEPEVPEPDL